MDHAHQATGAWRGLGVVGGEWGEGREGLASASRHSAATGTASASAVMCGPRAPWACVGSSLIPRLPPPPPVIPCILKTECQRMYADVMVRARARASARLVVVCPLAVWHFESLKHWNVSPMVSFLPLPVALAVQ